MAHMPNKWTFEVSVEPNDKVRLRAFIRNEIAYYNGILSGFAPWLRTSPELFETIDEGFMGELAATGLTMTALTADNLPANLKRYRSYLFDENGNSALDERTRLILGAIGSGVALHPGTRRAMVHEMIKAHRIQAAALSRTRKGELAAPVTLLQPHDGRVKRHVQLVDRAVVVDEGVRIRTAYTSQPVVIQGRLPADASWNIMILREGEFGDRDRWGVEFRQQVDKADYLLRLTDTPLRQKNNAPSQTRMARNMDGHRGTDHVRGRRL